MKDEPTEVQRYGTGWYGKATLSKVDHGHYVLFSDYEARIQELHDLNVRNANTIIEKNARLKAADELASCVQHGVKMEEGDPVHSALAAFRSSGTGNGETNSGGDGASAPDLGKRREIQVTEDDAKDRDE